MTETNADWWTGRYNGRQGLFPSNYVEKIFSHTPPQPDIPQYSEKSSWVPPIPSGPAYAPSYQPSGGYQGPPPPNQGGHYNSYSGPAPPNPTPVQPPGETANPPKKGPFGGKLGNTVCLSMRSTIFVLLIGNIVGSFSCRRCRLRGRYVKPMR